MRILHLDASVRLEGSTSRELSQFFIDKLRENGLSFKIDRLDLAETPPSHFGPVQTAAMYVSISDHTPEMRAALAESDGLAARVMAADALVCGVPVYNFGMPSAFKAFVDNISRSGITFEYTESGLVGRLAGKHVAFLTSAGGNYSEGAVFEGLDCLTPHIRAIFGFLGVPKPDVIRAHPTTFEGVAAKEKAVAEAEAHATEVAARWASELVSSDAD